LAISILKPATPSVASAPAMTAGDAAGTATAPAPERHVTEMAAPAALETGGVLTIDLSAIVKNWKGLANRVVPADCAAVVKADAYGCGVEEVATALAGAGCTTFFVAHLAEARRLRAVATDPAVYVLNGFAPGSAALFAEVNARPVIGSVAEYVEWDAFRAASGWRGLAALHFDTGMNRLGFTLAEAPLFTTRVKMPGHGISLVMSHLACADIPGHSLTLQQVEAFRNLRFLFRGLPTSLANSSGIFLGAAAHCDMVRPGAALFGVNPMPGTPNLMEPVVTLKARVVQVREVPRGATVGYGATWTAPRQARIAIVSVGYGDGYPRAAGDARSNLNPASKPGARAGAAAVIAGRRCLMAGRISMDLMAFDVTAVPQAQVRRGDDATLIGDGITVDDVAVWSGTIGYEVLTRLGRRYRRRWVE
jgi:alanine racemase